MTLLRLLVLLGSFASAERTLSVQCSCDAPGTPRPPTFDCASHCAPAAGAVGADMAVFNAVLNATMQGFFAPRHDERAEEERREAEKSRLHRETVEDVDRERRERDGEFERRRAEAREAARRRAGQDGAAAAGELKDDAPAGELALKDEPAGGPTRREVKSVLPQALELLRKAQEADADAERGLAQ